MKTIAILFMISTLLLLISCVVEVEKTYEPIGEEDAPPDTSNNSVNNEGNSDTNVDTVFGDVDVAPPPIPE